MKFVSIFKFDPATAAEPDAEAYAAMDRLIGEMREAGVLVDTGGVVPNGAHLRVRRGGGHITITDGPFAEAKEIVGGFGVLEVASKDEAIAWTRKFLETVGQGESELIEVGPTP